MISIAGDSRMSETFALYATPSTRMREPFTARRSSLRMSPSLRTTWNGICVLISVASSMKRAGKFSDFIFHER